jgi:hypothetical protein
MSRPRIRGIFSFLVSGRVGRSFADECNVEQAMTAIFRTPKVEDEGQLAALVVLTDLLLRTANKSLPCPNFTLALTAG